MSVYPTMKIRCQSNAPRYEAKNVVDNATPINAALVDTKRKFSLTN